VIEVEVAYCASAEVQALVKVSVGDAASVRAAIEASGLLARFPEIDLRHNPVGIFGERVALTRGLAAGDRVEIYRRLTTDPKQARRERARRRN
jgi:hypothetical protein